MLNKNQFQHNRMKYKNSPKQSGGAPNTEDSNNDFSPRRRVWIRKGNGTPTTVQVHFNDLVDDLKQLVVNKFPNSLAKQVDPADVNIKMVIVNKQASSATQINKNNSPAKAVTSMYSPYQQSQFSVSENIPSPKPFSPISLHFNANNFKVLEPDQVVWSILDMHYPQGMTLQDAFVVDEPQNEIYENQEKSLSNSSIPATLSNRTGTPKFSNGYYHQPQPQARHLSLVPGEIQTSHKPNFPILPASLSDNVRTHKRSQSIPPLPSLGRTISPHLSSNCNPNSQAVLLLPKNYTLSNGSVVNHENYGLRNFKPFKKSLSLDLLLANNSDEKTFTKLEQINSLNSETQEEDKVKQDPDWKPYGSTHKNMMDLKYENDRAFLSPSQDLYNNDDNKISSSSSPTLKKEDATTLWKDIGDLTMKTATLKDTADSDFNAKTDEDLSKSSATRTPSLKAPKAAPGVLPSINVLVVEDNSINQAILGAFLRKHKIHYQIAKNGQEAVDKWRKGGFHLVLMDIQLPVKSGLEATRDIRRLEKLNHIGVFDKQELYQTDISDLKEDEKLKISDFRSPVIIVALTASSNSSIDKTNALRAGCNDYLTKPVNLVWLQKKITEWGCMQALIDFSGWKAKSTVPESKATKPIMATSA